MAHFLFTPLYGLNQELQGFTKYLKDYKDNLKLYRYSPADYWNIRNIETGKLKLSPIGKLNDIYEGIPNEDLSKVRPEDWRQLEEIAYLKCFSENYDHLLMWSHYADEYRGICVEYDLSLLPKDAQCLNHLFPVCYREGRFLKSNLKWMADDLKTMQIAILEQGGGIEYSWLSDVTALFLVKGLDWEYEQEWRFIVTKLQMHQENIFEDLFVPFDCISAIYFGLRTSSEVKKNIKEITCRIDEKRDIKIPKVKLYETYLHDSKYIIHTREVTACPD